MNCIEIHQLHFAFKQQVIFNNFDFVLPKVNGALYSVHLGSENQPYCV
ncbi:Uncharacterised protein [Actinobacillus pleuropneumoniae]|nr:Uncharacterised protein [Actinobacillus pleuropneumoniae]